MLTKNYAAAYFCAWVINILTFNKIYKAVKPLMDEVDKRTEEVRIK